MNIIVERSIKVFVTMVAHSWCFVCSRLGFFKEVKQ